MYKKRSDYLVGYDIKDNQIIQYYYKDKNKDVIPNIQYNVEFCNAKLEKQFKEIKPEDIQNIETDRNIAIANLIIPDLYLLYLSIFVHPFFLAFLTPIVLLDVGRIVSKTKIIKRFELTNFCLEHIDEIEKITRDSSTELKLSRGAKKILELDKGFKLNHSDRYHVSDLKQIQKAIRTK